MTASKNPFDYRPAQIAKALVALLTSIVGLLGVAASVAATGDLQVVGHWATATALCLTPIVVFLKRAQPFLDAVDPSAGNGQP